jgi:hypothetical protein
VTRLARAAALALWAAGLAIGSWADRPDVPAPAHIGGFRVIAADLHVHAYPGDGALPPWEISHEARRRRIDAVALTNHNQMLASRLAAAVGIRDEALLIPGEEVTTPRYHLAAVGLTEPIDRRSSVADVADRVRQQGGAAIAAHPARMFWRAFDDGAVAALDGVEAAHPGMDYKGFNREDYAAFAARARTLHPGIAHVGSSDYHDLWPIGECRTYLFVRDATVAGIVEAIRAGRTVACDAHGVTYGPPSMAASVRDRCAADAAWDPTRGIDRAGAGCALGGLLLLLVLPAGPRRAHR